MLEKSRYWESAFPLITTLLTVAPREMFLERWYPLVENNYGKLKERGLKGILVQNIARLVWVAIFRCTEDERTLSRKIEMIFRMFFPPGRRVQQTADLPQMPLIQLVRFVGFKYQDLCLRTMMIPLIVSDHLNNTNSSIDLDSLYPERISIAVRAFNTLIDDNESDSGNPPFPIDFNISRKPTGPPQIIGSKASSIIQTPNFRDFYNKFSVYLCKIAILCDHYYGASAKVGDRTPSGARSVLPNNEIGSLFNAEKERQPYYDLLSATLEALPRCLTASSSISKVVEIICKATVHQEKNVRLSAKAALRALGKSERVQPVVVVYGSVMFKHDNVSPHNYEAQLKLYIELLHLWVERIQYRSRDGESGPPRTDQVSQDNARSEEMEMTNIWTIIEEIEACGLFFLCNQSRLIRKCAIEILRTVSLFDAAMDQQKDHTKSNHTRQNSKSSQRKGSESRIIDILLAEGPSILESIFDQASVAEKSRTTKLKHERSDGTLIKIAVSESGVDAAIWFKIFPRLIGCCFARFPITVVLCRNMVCNQLLKMQSSIINAIETMKPPNPFDVISRATSKVASSPESTVEQWKLYLIMACCTLTLTDEQTPNKSQSHGRKGSVPVASFERITSARSLFQLVLPLLSVDRTSVRDAIVTALGCINVNLYKVLLDDLRPTIVALSDATKQSQHYKSNAVRNGKKLDRLRTEIAHILQLTAHFLKDETIRRDESILEIVFAFLKDVKSFLGDDEIQNSWEYQKLRRYFCELLESVWEALQLCSNPSRWLPFEGRISCFRMIEEWCNHGPQEVVAKAREESMRQSIMNAHKDNRDRGALTASLEIEKRNVEFAALSVMASLCKGPVTQTVDMLGNKRAAMSFEIDGLFSWIAAVFGSSSEKVHSVGRRALNNLLRCNLDFSILYQEAIHQCYTHDFDSKSAQSYFTVLAEVLTEQTSNPCGLSQLLALCLFKAGDKNVDIRSKTLKLLKATEIRFYGQSCADAFTAAITNQNSVVYKRAQYLLAAQVAKNHEEQKFLIFSECSKIFRLVETRLQRDVVAIVLPWLQIMELQLDVDGQNLDAPSHMVLVNLYEMTLRNSDTLLNEVEGLWTALVTGRYIGNVKAILDFTISQSVARREPLFVSCGKQVIVYLSRSTAGPKVVEALFSYLQPRSMVPQLKEPIRFANEQQKYAYVADLDRVFQGQQKHVVFSLGQLALIFLVDLMVTPAHDLVAQTPTLLLVVFIMLDHYIPVVQDQARELFVYLSHNLCVDNGPQQADRSSLQAFLQDIRKRELGTTWSYEEMSSLSAEVTHRIPEAMETLIRHTLVFYADRIPNLKDQWGNVALNWATACPVRHMACRAFQVYQCLRSPIDQNMLSDMLARLSNTIADNSNEIQAFSMEILCTIKVVVSNLDAEGFTQFPQLFWCAVACLETIHEQEFLESLAILEKILDKLDVTTPTLAAFILSNMPPKWDGKYEGLASPLLKGMRSDNSMRQTLSILNRMIEMPSNELLGPDSRFLFTLLANLPFLIHAFNEMPVPAETVSAAVILSNAAARQDLTSLAKVLGSYSQGKIRTADEFVRQISLFLRQAYFPDWEPAILTFLLGLLSNRASWVKLCSMELLKAILPFVDTRRAEFAGVGADLISPLLRLLQTEFAQAGLEVLDKAIAIPSGLKDRQVLRMSLGNRTIRKEYEKTATLFGIPEESGWAVPMPAAAASTTRANVHAVFYTCTVTMATQELPDHVQFHMEDYAYHPPSERSETLLSVDGGESSLGDMVSALHNLDVFFTEDVDVLQPAKVETTAAVEQASATMYDSRVAAILSRSLARTPSISSFTSPGFDVSPLRDRKSPGIEKDLASPVLTNGFSFPNQTRPTVSSPHKPKSPVLSSDDEPERPFEIVIDDDHKSEASFKLDTQLKKSGTSVKAKLFATKESDRNRQHNRKPPKMKANTELRPTSPSTRAYFWSSNTSKDRA